MAELDEFQSGSDMHLYEKLNAMPIELPYIRKNVKEFIKFVDPLITDAKNLQPGELIQLLRVSLDYDRFITDDDLPSPDDVKIESLNQLQLAAARFNDIESFIKYTETFRDESVSDNKEGVRLMTIHKSKGLEYPVISGPEVPGPARKYVKLPSSSVLGGRYGAVRERETRGGRHRQ